MSGPRFHMICGVFWGNVPIEYGLLEHGETRRHAPIMVEPGDLGNIFVARHGAVMVTPGTIGAVRTVRHGTVMVNSGAIGPNEIKRHTFLKDRVGLDQWEYTLNASDKFDVDLTILDPEFTGRTVEYSIEGGAWVATGIATFPDTITLANATGQMIRLRVDGSAPSAPTLLSPFRGVGTNRLTTTGNAREVTITGLDVTKAHMVIIADLTTSSTANAHTMEVRAVGDVVGSGTTYSPDFTDNGLPLGSRFSVFFVPAGSPVDSVFRAISTRTDSRMQIEVFEQEAVWTAGAHVENSATAFPTTVVLSPDVLAAPRLLLGLAMVHRAAPRSITMVPDLNPFFGFATPVGTENEGFLFRGFMDIRTATGVSPVNMITAGAGGGSNNYYGLILQLS